METGYFNRMELQLTRARPLRNILMELRLTLYENMSGLRRAQMADCNPMDYAVWDSLSQKVYAWKQDKFTENELKKQIRKYWKDITLGEIQKTISVWKTCLRTVVAENGGHIDHLV